MSKSTPRKSRHRHNASNGGPMTGGPSNGGGPRQIAASDYESDAAHYMEARDVPRLAHLPTRTNTDLNISVLRRYLPGIRSILSIAANAVVYTFSEAGQSWEKHGVAGTMFVCEQQPKVTASGQALPRVSVFVLNRLGLDNLMVDLVRVSDCEMADELIIFRLEDDDASDSNGEGSTGKEVIGIWIHADEDDTREANTAIIRGAWQQARLALNTLIEAAAAEAEQLADQTDADDGGALADAPHHDISEKSGLIVGRRISITDLFGQRNGAG
ncbi:hypothetical protein B0T16DRAFT_406560 [Cercophora newfieldiana]|uniref:Dcp1-like decapping family protein n=1 Tax=Cercophora newfieldiana TaxID=92897 RepID=A0AA39YHY9_9PEZI|nr:hypothetical protein B0T16DRAFT_406560 [Cercophora newfieldiana]